MLKFIGIGGAFSENLGNCAAYYKIDNKTLVLFDCGETVFNDILNSKLLVGVNKLYIIITHFHSDHIGSLGSLLFYCDYLNISEVNVIYPDQLRMKDVINLFGVQKTHTKIIKPNEVLEFKLQEYKQSHSIMEAYGYLFNHNRKKIFYSGDTKEIPADIKNKLLNDEIDIIYQDVRCDADYNSYHITLTELIKLIPEEVRHKIYCMHISNNEDKKLIKKYGFNVVEKQQ